MSFLGRIRGDDDQDRADSGLAHVAGVLVDVGFDDWGLLLVMLGCVAAVVL